MNADHPHHTIIPNKYTNQYIIDRHVIAFKNLSEMKTANVV